MPARWFDSLMWWVFYCSCKREEYHEGDTCLSPPFLFWGLAFICLWPQNLWGKKSIEIIYDISSQNFKWGLNVAIEKERRLFFLLSGNDTRYEIPQNASQKSEANVTLFLRINLHNYISIFLKYVYLTFIAESKV